LASRSDRSWKDRRRFFVACLFPLPAADTIDLDIGFSRIGQDGPIVKSCTHGIDQPDAIKQT
jgi:hypothetical protein